MHYGVLPLLLDQSWAEPLAAPHWPRELVLSTPKPANPEHCSPVEQGLRTFEDDCPRTSWSTSALSELAPMIEPLQLPAPHVPAQWWLKPTALARQRPPVLEEQGWMSGGALESGSGEGQALQPLALVQVSCGSPEPWVDVESAGLLPGHR